MSIALWLLLVTIFIFVSRFAIFSSFGLPKLINISDTLSLETSEFKMQTSSSIFSYQILYSKSKLNNNNNNNNNNNF